MTFNKQREGEVLEWINSLCNGKSQHLLFTNTTVQSQKAESAYFTSKQILPFDLAEQNSCEIPPQFPPHSGNKNVPIL